MNPRYKYVVSLIAFFAVLVVVPVTLLHIHPHSTFWRITIGFFASLTSLLSLWISIPVLFLVTQLEATRFFSGRISKREWVVTDWYYEKHEKYYGIMQYVVFHLIPVDVGEKTKLLRVDNHHEQMDMYDQQRITGMQIRFIRSNKIQRFQGSYLSLESDWLIPVIKEEPDDERGTHPKFEPVSTPRVLQEV